MIKILGLLVLVGCCYAYDALIHDITKGYPYVPVNLAPGVLPAPAPLPQALYDPAVRSPYVPEYIRHYVRYHPNIDIAVVDNFVKANKAEFSHPIRKTGSHEYISSDGVPVSVKYWHHL